MINARNKNNQTVSVIARKPIRMLLVLLEYKLSKSIKLPCI